MWECGPCGALHTRNARTCMVKTLPALAPWTTTHCWAIPCVSVPVLRLHCCTCDHTLQSSGPHSEVTSSLKTFLISPVGNGLPSLSTSRHHPYNTVIDLKMSYHTEESQFTFFVLFFWDRISLFNSQTPGNFLASGSWMLDDKHVPLCLGTFYSLNCWKTSFIKVPSSNMSYAQEILNKCLEWENCFIMCMYPRGHQKCLKWTCSFQMGSCLPCLSFQTRIGVWYTL